jgi:hypothetical protein
MVIKVYILEEIIRTLKKEREQWSGDEMALLNAYLGESQVRTPRHTLFCLLIEWAKVRGLSLSLARELVSVDQLGVTEAWRTT